MEISQGNIHVYQVDEKGNIWLTEILSESGCPYIVEYETAENKIISDYIAGLPGFGGSDKVLSVKIIDVIPPVIKCSLRKTETTEWGVDEKWYDGLNPIGKGITATDNIDGDLTAQIVSESKRTSNDEWYYGLIVVYSVTDSAGNTAKLTVRYDIDKACMEGYHVVSIE